MKVDEGLGRREYITMAALAAVLGVLVYLPSFRTQFFMDDVSHFGSLVEALAHGRLAEWLFQPGNGHIIIVPKFFYWVDYRFFARSIVFWHALTLALHAMGTVSCMYILYSFTRRIYLSAFLAMGFATSTVFSENINMTNSFNHHIGITFVFISLALICHYINSGKRTSYALSVIAAILSITSTAFGFIVFPAHFLFFWAFSTKEKSNRTQMALSALLVLSSAGLFIYLGQVSGQGGGIDLIFGLKQTYYGLLRVTASKTLRAIGIPLMVLAIYNLMRHRRDADMKLVLVGVFLLVAPLLMALSGRSDFIKPYNWSRYHHIPALGFLLIVGLGLITPNMERYRTAFRKFGWGWWLAVLFLVLNSGYVFYWNTDSSAHDTLREFEDSLGSAVVEYAGHTDTRLVTLPDIVVQAPHYPLPQKLIFFARYATPYRAAIVLDEGDAGEEFLRFLEESGRYQSVLERIN